GRRILTTLASRFEPTKDSIVLTNSPSAPDRSHGGASGKLSVEETGTLPPARSPIPRSNPSEPPDIKQIGGSRLRAAVPGPHGPPFADVPGQIAPGNTGAVSVEDALDHLSGVGGRGGLVGLSALAGGRRRGPIGRQWAGGIETRFQGFRILPRHARGATTRMTTRTLSSSAPTRCHAQPVCRPAQSRHSSLSAHSSRPDPASSRRRRGCSLSHSWRRREPSPPSTSSAGPH